MIKKLLKTIGMTVLILALLVMAAAVVGSVFRDEMLLSPWGTGLFRIASGSMGPKIPDGSVILVASVPEDKIVLGDVITFFSSDRAYVVTHRVMQIDETGDSILFTTRGDANNADDMPITYDRIIGRVIFTVPGSSFVIKALGNAVYVGVAIIGIGVGLCISGIVSTVRKRKKIKAEASTDGQGIPDDDGREKGAGSDPESLVADEVIDSNRDGFDSVPGAVLHSNDIDVNKEADLEDILKEAESDETLFYGCEKDEKKEN